MRFALILSCLVAFALPARAAPYPDRPIRLIVPFTPGGALDVAGRIVAERLATGLGQPIVIDNRAGAGGVIGADMVAKAAPDGYTLLVGSASTHGTNPAIVKNLPYDAVSDFTPIVLVARFPHLLVTSPKLPVRDTAELIAWARSRPNKLNYASYGPGSANHLPMELFLAMTGLEMVHIPYKGATPAIAALTQGEVDLMFDSPATSFQPIRTGLVNLVGVGSPARSPFFPDAPTIGESGLPGFESESFIGFFAPPNLPPALTERILRETLTALSFPDVRERLTTVGYEVVGADGAALGKTVATAVAKWTHLVQERRLTFD